MIIKSMFSMAALNAVKAACSLLVSFLVAKTVGPDDFGLVSFAIPLMTFITILTDLGLGSAIVRHPTLDRYEAGSAVTLMLLAGVSGGLVLAVAAYPLEHYLRIVGLGRVLAGFGLVTLLTIWAAAPRALLEREYAYRKIAMVELPALICGLTACGSAIWLHQGIMAIVIYQVTMQLIRALVFILVTRRGFQINIKWANLSGLVNVGGWLLVSNLMTYFARNLDNILIGTFIGAHALGIYGLAYQFMTLPLILITWPVSGVLLSTLSKLRGNDDDRRNVICAVVMFTAVITFPMMTLMSFGSKVPISLIYSNKWQGLAMAITLLAPAGAAQSIASYGGAVLIERGALRLNFALNVLISSSFVLAFLATVRFGIFTLMEAYTVISILVCLFHVYFICRVSGIRYMRMARCLVPGMSAAGSALAVTYLVFGLAPIGTNAWLSSIGLYLAIVGIVILGFYKTFIPSIRILGGLATRFQVTQPALATVPIRP